MLAGAGCATPTVTATGRVGRAGVLRILQGGGAGRAPCHLGATAGLAGRGALKGSDRRVSCPHFHAHATGILPVWRCGHSQELWGRVEEGRVE